MNHRIQNYNHIKCSLSAIVSFELFYRFLGRCTASLLLCGPKPSLFDDLYSISKAKAKDSENSIAYP